jgi:hypothetical protein
VGWRRRFRASKFVERGGDRWRRSVSRDAVFGLEDIHRSHASSTFDIGDVRCRRGVLGRCQA